jgi:hypothetical protein
LAMWRSKWENMQVISYFQALEAFADG